MTQPTSGDVRYFYEEDAARAQQIKQIVERALVERGAKMLIELRFPKSLASKVPRGWLEVWLPSLPKEPTIKPPMATSKGYGSPKPKKAKRSSEPEKRPPSRAKP